MAASSTRREIGDYIIDKDDDNCIGETYKVRVYVGHHKDNEKTAVAGKMFTWGKRYPTKEVDDEIEFMKSIPPHENVLKLLDHGTTETKHNKELWLILEHCNLGHLGDFVHTRPLNLAQKLDLMVQSAKGVHHLHHMDKPLIHRDIKPANLLIAGKPGQPVVKVADYGESRFFEGSSDASLRNMTLKGTRSYLAPEISDLNNQRPEYNKAVDIFALGMSFQYVLEAIVGNFFQKPLTVTVGDEEITLGSHLRDNPNTDVARLLMKPGDSADVRDIKLLIAEMLARDVSERLTIDQVLRRLRELRTRLGTQTLVAVDTVWDDPVFYFDKDLMKSIEAKIKEKKSSDAESSGPADPQEHRATPDPPERNARLRMDHVERVLSDTKDVLDQLNRLRVRCEQLLAVSVIGHRGVWMHEGSEWERVGDVPSECAKYAVCLCRVHGGMIVCGGGVRGVQVSGHCHHFSRLTRQWKKLADMITPRSNASAVEYAAQEVLVAGGVARHGHGSAVCEVLDYQNDTWHPESDMPKALHKPLMAAEGGKVYILQQIGISKPFKLLIYKPSGKEGISTRPSFKYTSALPDDVRGTGGACLAAAGQRLYLLGGERGLALAYTPLTDQWEHLSPPSLSCHTFGGCCAAVLARRITVFGGSSTKGGKRDGAEVYNTRADKWHTLDMRLPFDYDKFSALVAQYDN